MARDEEMNWFGCFRYTAEPDGDRAEIHIGNHMAPASPFADRRRKFGWMQQLLEDAARNAPQDQAHRHELVAEQLRCLHRAVSGGLPRFVRRRRVPTACGDWVPGGSSSPASSPLNQPRAETLKREQRFELVQYRGTCEFGDLVEHVGERLSGM